MKDVRSVSLVDRRGYLTVVLELEVRTFFKFLYTYIFLF